MESSAAYRRWVLASVAAASLLAPNVGFAGTDDVQKLTPASRRLVRDAADYSFRQWLRERIVRAEDQSRYGLQCDEGWEAVAGASPEKPLVVLLHGFNSTPQRNEAVLTPIRAAGFPCASFAYPNDWELASSAALLSSALKSFQSAHPQQRVALVTHSMGGIVARACLETDGLDPANVDRLIMIAPPSQGTLLAHFAIATDLWEHWLNRADGGCWARWRDSVVDGLGEAADDLAPGSAFLTALNACPRNPRVRYTILLGASASFEEGEMEWIRSALQKTSGRCTGLRSCSRRVDALLADLEEIVDGKGDGVVAIKRGRLEGVDDIVILPFGHLSCTGKPDCEGVRQVQREVLARLHRRPSDP
ncbi:MAG: hypothetical protein DCC67_05895 [Planctomycetota bacterium]|nr:MAG: hypothetical protein DCC67_05895 [Planctomycetota bacterium]